MGWGLFVKERLDKGMIPAPSEVGRDGVRFHHTAQNGAPFKLTNCLLQEFSI